MSIDLQRSAQGGGVFSQQDYTNSGAIRRDEFQDFLLRKVLEDGRHLKKLTDSI
jgi:hypothetical protein